MFIDPNIKWPVTVFFEDGSSEDYDSPAMISNTLEDWDTTREDKCSAKDAEGVLIFIKVHLTWIETIKRI